MERPHPQVYLHNIDFKDTSELFGTPLVRSLRVKEDEGFIMRLLTMNPKYDVNKASLGFYPLHLAISRNYLLVAHELIARSADINQQDLSGNTPLYLAVQSDNIAAVHMLLYYGADLEIANFQDKTPFIKSLELAEEDISLLLFKYYDEYSFTYSVNESALYYALKNRSPLTASLIEAEANVNYVAENGDCLLTLTLNSKDYLLFKLIWSRIDYQVLLNSPFPFLLVYLNNCTFPTSEWIRCLYLILNSSVAFELIQESEFFVNEMVSFLWSLLCALDRMNVDLPERMAIIYICLNLGANVRISHIELALYMFRFKEEVEALIYCASFSIDECLRDGQFPLLVFILALEKGTDPNIIFQLFENEITLTFAPVNILRTLPYFSLSFEKKQRLGELCTEYLLRFEFCLCRDLDKVSNIPSLLELSRNKAREFIKKNYDITKPYQFHDAVKALKLPTLMKDIIRFKRPIY